MFWTKQHRLVIEDSASITSLLKDQDSVSQETEDDFHCQCCQKKTLFPIIKQLADLVIFSLFGILIAILFFMGLWTLPSINLPDAAALLYSPGDHLVEYQLHRFYRSRGDDLSPFQGWPDDEKDQVWQDAYYPGLFTYIEADSAAQMTNETSRVALPGLEDKYMVVLDVFHQLHCLNFVREAFYPERYGRGMYHPNGTLNYCIWRHIDHCIDQVRQSLMCSADISPIPVQWNNATKSMRPRVDTMHTCKNFDKLREWALERNVSQFHGAARVVEQGGSFVIENYGEAKRKGTIDVDPSECNAI